MSYYEERRRRARIAWSIFIAALFCLALAVVTADGWTIAQRLLAGAAILGIAAMAAAIAASAS